MLATAVDRLPAGSGWAYEFKWDGVRALLDVSERGVVLQSRAGNDITAGYPEIVTLGEGVGDGLFDGEIVMFVDGRPSFEALQQRMHVRGSKASEFAASLPATFVAFDLLRRYGVDLTARAYVERRATLDRVIEQHQNWTLSPFFDDGVATEAAARTHGLEGVVAKRLASTYQPGVRSPDWQKLRFVKADDFVVIGWEASRDHPDRLSSLILGNRDFAFVGKVGSGLDARTAAALQSRLTVVEEAEGRLETTADPVVEEAEGRLETTARTPPPPSPGRVMYLVRPEVVVEVRFSERTADGRLRQPVFVRIREDKTVDEL